eukprot:9232860-Heterocapsa_arctica.AAC.1
MGRIDSRVRQSAKTSKEDYCMRAEQIVSLIAGQLATTIPNRRDPRIPEFAREPPRSSLLPAKPYLHSRGPTSTVQVWITGMYRSSSQNALSPNGY